MISLSSKEMETTNELMKAFQTVQQVARQLNSVNEQIERAAQSPLARLNDYIAGPLSRYEETVDRVLRQQQTSFDSFQRATASLDRHQFNRVNQVLDGWQSPIAPNPALVGTSPLKRFVAWVNRRRRPDSFQLYLRRAHEHPAIARGRGGRRLWFEVWRRAALLALADGISFNRLRTAASGLPPPRPRLALPRPRRQSTIRHRFQMRLHHTIVPHGPTPGSLPSHVLFKGGGLLAPIG